MIRIHEGKGDAVNKSFEKDSASELYGSVFKLYTLLDAVDPTANASTLYQEKLFILYVLPLHQAVNRNILPGLINSYNVSINLKLLNL